MSTNYFEANFDGLVAPYHNYAGLAPGNLASQASANKASNPKAAALEGLKKAKFVRDLGFQQGILAPQARADVSTLKQLGFYGSEQQVIAQAAKQAPHLLANCYSASSMWTANAATVTPSCDSRDGKIHFTPANLLSQFHRSIEAPTTAKILQATFKDAHYFSHHRPLPMHPDFSDEGAANHNRLSLGYGKSGLNVFVYGIDQQNPSLAPKRYPARQTLMASQTIARKHQINPQQAIYLQQSAQVIDQGVFHNDVISVANQNVFFYHEQAFTDPSQLQLIEHSPQLNGQLELIKVPQDKVTVEQAVASYLFNTQLIGEKGNMTLIAPTQCYDILPVHQYLEELKASNASINHVHYVEVKQSMANGGGPACLRLRVEMNQQQAQGVNSGSWLTDENYLALTNWVEKHYRDHLTPADLADFELYLECQQALDELTQIMGLGSIYPFQQN